MSLYRPQFSPCILKCQACAGSCHAAMADMFGAVQVTVDESRYFRLAMDCAQLCEALNDFMARGSDQVASLGLLCEKVCAQSADVFAASQKETWLACAEAAHLCASECQRMLASLKHGAAEKPTGGPYAA